MSDAGPVLPLLRLPGGKVFGVSDNEWVAMWGDGTLRPFARAFFALWPILECSQDEVDALIQHSARELGLALESVPPFPHVDVVTAGLRATSEHWQSLALARVRHAPDRAPFIEDLGRLVRDGATQRLRHEAKRLAAAARRAQQV